MTALRKCFPLALAACVATALPALAQEPAPPVLTLELNSLQPSDKGCRLTFVVANNLGAELTKAAFEIALFNDAGIVDTLTVLDFNELPVGKTKVARFDIAGSDCARISRILINHATECVGPGIQTDACQRQLVPKTKSAIVFGM